MDFDRDYLEEKAKILLDAESIMQDKDLMKEIRPVLEDMKKAAERLQGFDFKAMKELASKKELEEKSESDGKKLSDNTEPEMKIPGKA